ncbi:MAG: TlpA disulfide reductase family protein [Bacteroidota bacterium]
MRFILLLSLLFVLQFGYGQKTIAVKTQTQGCTQQLALYTFDGTSFKPVLASENEADVYTFNVPAEGHRFYYFGPKPDQLKPVILGEEENVQLQVSCNNTKPTQVFGSAINNEYAALKQRFGEINRMNQKAITTFRRGMRDEAVKAQGKAELAEVDQARRQLLDSLQKSNPFLARVAALNTYLSFFNNNEEGKYSNEIEYFAREYFQFVDWKDEGFHSLPWVYEGFKTYTTTLSQVYRDAETFNGMVDQTVAEIPRGSLAEKLALGGIISILKQKKHPSFQHYAETFIRDFKDQDPQAASDLEAQIKAQQSFVVGGEAPDFSQPSPAGEAISLSDLRGKVVLVDFWASWCGPCRRENPNVKRVYNEYKDQGFEILAVSLDRTKDRWTQAIAKDGLEWLHVSDLKGWKNEVAQLYSVTSIPHTILLDREGKIIARGLRGPQLEQKLAEVMNETGN